MENSPNNPANPPSPDTTNLSNPVSGYSSKILFAAFIISIITLTVISFKYLTLQKEFNQIKSSIAPQAPPPANPLPSPTPEPAMDISDWETYSHIKARIEFKYPKGWKPSGGEGIDWVYTLASPKGNMIFRLHSNKNTILNECYLQISQSSSNINSYIYSITKFTGVSSGEMCSSPTNLDNREIWAKPDASPLGITFNYHQTNTAEAEIIFSTILSTVSYPNITQDAKAAVLSTLDSYLKAIINHDRNTALSYITNSVKSEVPTNWPQDWYKYKTYEGLNEFHSASEEQQFYSQEQITFQVKFYRQNDAVGERVNLLFVKQNGQWKTPTWNFL